MADVSLPFIPRMNTNSCCCFNARTGCLIIGALGIIGSIISLIQNEVLIINNNQTKNNWRIIITPFIACMPSIIIHYLLIRGVTKEKPKLMYPWIYITFIGLILSVVSPIVFSILIITMEDSSNGPNPIFIVIGFFISMIIFIAISYYFFSTVVTHCQHLLFNQNNHLNQIRQKP